MSDETGSDESANGPDTRPHGSTLDGSEEVHGARSDAVPSATMVDAAGPEPLLPETTNSPVKAVIHIHATPRIGYDLVHNGQPIVRGLQVRPASNTPLTDVTVTVTLQEGSEDLAEPWERDFDSIPIGGLQLEPELRLDPARMRNLEEARPARVTVTVSSGSVTLAAKAQDVLLTAHNQWSIVPGSERLSMALLAAHVQPNDPVVADVLKVARQILERTTGSGSTEGYQAGPQRAAQIAAAVYEAIVALGFEYSDPPASWDQPGQKIRTHGQVFAEKAATCLDSAVLYAAALEQAGLHPLLWLPWGHALVGVWVEEDRSLPMSALADPQGEGVLLSAALNAADAGIMLLVETTVIPDRATFEDARRAGRERVNSSMQPIHGVVDIRLARRESIIPLPATRVAADGTVEVFTYQAGAIHVAKKRESTRQRRSASGEAPSRVQQWKNTLLDLSLRNQLVNFRPTRGAVSLILPPSDDQLHPLDFIEDQLHESRALTLLPLTDASNIEHARGVGAGAGRADADFMRRALVGDGMALAALDEDRYLPALRRLRYASRASVQESGANNLYLTLGTLIWNSDGRDVKSPLILVPITLEGGTRQTPFRIALDESGASTPNYCLLEKLKLEHDLALPTLENPLEDDAGVAVRDIIQSVRREIADAGHNFRIDETAHLAILQFTKFRLWKDLEDHWERFATNDLVKHLVHTPTEQYSPSAQPQTVRGDLDDLASECPVPADASQLEAIERAVAGETFVLEGPPGTGKSQTITNLLARAIAEGRRVLFVAEKRAALDVVQSRLDAVGLAPFCLDLHDKGSKPAVVRKQLADSLTFHPYRDPAGLEAAHGQLRSAVTILSRYRDRLHSTNSMGESLYSAHDKLLAMGPGSSIPVEVEDVEAISSEDWQDVKAHLPQIGESLERLGSISQNPWRFAGPASFDELDRPALASLITRLYTSLDVARRSLLGQECLKVVDAGQTVQPVLDFAASDPPGLAVLDQVASPDWASQVDALLAELAAAVGNPALRGVKPSLLDISIAEIHQQAVTADASGFFGRKKRRMAALERLRPALGPDYPEPALATLSTTTGGLADAGQRLVTLRSQLAALPGLGAFTTANPLDPTTIRSLRDTVSRLRTAAGTVTIASPQRDAHRILAHVEPRSAEGAQAALDVSQAAAQIADVLSVDDDDMTRWAQGGSVIDALERDRAHLLADSEAQRFKRLAQWLDFAQWRKLLAECGLTSTLEALEDDAVDPMLLEESVTRGVLQACVTERARAGRLDAFQPDAHARSVQRFATASASMRERMKEEIPSDLVRARPFDADSLSGQVGALQRELNKTRRGMSIRALIRNYGNVISSLTPCFLVSPDSVARFLEPGTIDFDLVVFDEASQIRVAEAVGAMGRGKGVVVVGDSRQMPPSQFGAAGTGDDDYVDEDDDVVIDEESILSECVQARVPRRWLSWHYRSKDEALIAFSNDKYYEGRLSSFPAPRADSQFRSISHTLINGHFIRSGEKGRLRTNPTEARAVVEEVVERFRRDPLASIGVVTLNIQQRDLLISMLSDCDEPKVVESLESDSKDSLFVKNLENVQGDERDLIIFSLGFSKNDKGVLPLNFGPLNRNGGERRLNVAVTRARRQVRVFSSFMPSDIRVEQTASVGIRHLHGYLEMAVRGTHELSNALGRRHVPPDRHRDLVAGALRDRGWPVRTDVGLSEFRIDIAIGARNDPDRDLCAVLLDGPGWAKRATVGDRDGLPVEVLEKALEWPCVRRIWLPSWLEDQQKILDELEHDIRQVEAGLPTRPLDIASTAEIEEASEFEQAVLDDHPVQALRVDHEHPTVKSTPSAETEFREWWCSRYLDRSLLDEDTSRSRREIASVLREGADAEGPIHVERLVKLVADGMGIQRLKAERARLLQRLIPKDLPRTEEGTIVWPTGANPGNYRQYRPSWPHDRPFKHVPRAELANAMIPICQQSMGINEEELLKQTLKVFNGERLTAQIRSRLEDALQDALSDGKLVKEGDLCLPGVGASD